MKISHFLVLTATLVFSTVSQAELVFKDDSGREVRLKTPAQRIVTLAPHAAESLYAAGGGDKLVGTVDYSDYPPAAKKVPRVGGYSRVDLEAVAALKPDLVIAWESGNNMTQVDKLKALGLAVYVFQPNQMTSQRSLNVWASWPAAKSPPVRPPPISASVSKNCAKTTPASPSSGCFIRSGKHRS